MLFVDIMGKLYYICIKVSKLSHWDEHKEPSPCVLRYVEKNTMDISEEKLKYLFRFIDEFIYDSIDEVLNDSQTDPHYSAVVVSNIIKCYIDLEKELGTQLPYIDVETFFEFNGYSKQEYKKFEKSRQKESKYYKDIQYESAQGKCTGDKCTGDGSLCYRNNRS